MVHEVEGPIKLEDDEEDGDEVIGVNDKCLKSVHHYSEDKLLKSYGTLVSSGVRLRSTLHHGEYLD